MGHELCFQVNLNVPFEEAKPELLKVLDKFGADEDDVKERGLLKKRVSPDGPGACVTIPVTSWVKVRETTKRAMDELVSIRVKSGGKKVKVCEGVHEPAVFE